MKENITTTSPIVTKKPETIEHQVDFFVALRAVLDNKKITKLEWGNENVYGWLDATILKLHKENGVDDNWILSEGDLVGDDWIVIT